MYCTTQHPTISRQSNATLTRTPLQIQIKPRQLINGTFAAASLYNINKMNALLQRLFAVVPHSNILQSEDTPSLLYLSYKLRGDEEKENFLLIIQNFSMLCYVQQQPVYLRSCEDTPKGKLVIFFLLLYRKTQIKQIQPWEIDQLKWRDKKAQMTVSALAAELLNPACKQILVPASLPDVFLGKLFLAEQLSKDEGTGREMK